MDFAECFSDTVSTVAAAARAGSRRRVRALIHQGYSIDSKDNRGWNALHEAAAAGSTECVRELLSAVAGSSRRGSAYVGSRNHEGESALYLAAQRGYLAVVRLLVNARANINQSTNDGSCPIYAAVDGGHKEVVELLIRKGAKINGKHTESCWTCLHQAAYKGYCEMVRLLVAVPGCQLEARDDHQITPLFVAAQYGQQHCLEILVDAGADVNTQAGDLATPLMIASQEGHEGCVEVLLAHGANPNLVCSMGWPQLPIHAAAEFGHISILKRLCTVTDRVCDRKEGMVSPVYSALDQRESMALLLKEGFHPDAQNCTPFLFYETPLTMAFHSAGVSNQVLSDSVKLLIAAGASLNQRVWIYVLGTDKPDMLQLILQHRRVHLSRPVPGSHPLNGSVSSPEQSSWSASSPELSVSSMSSPEQSSSSMSSPEQSNSSTTSPEQSSSSMYSPDASARNVACTHLQSSGSMSSPEQSSGSMPGPEQSRDLALNAEELAGLVSVAVRKVHHAACWLPLLLSAGLEPSLLMHPNMLKEVKSEVLNYLLEFVNWSTLARPLRQILDQRQENETWTPHTHLECMPSLSHLCRLQIRELLGSYALMQTPVAQQLPLPPPLQRYIQFTNILPP